MKKTAILIIAALLIAVAGYVMAGDLARDGFNTPIQGALLPGTTQNISISGTATRSTVMGSQIARIVCTTNCFARVGGSTVTAVAGTSAYIPAGVVEYFTVKDNFYVSIITTTATGNAYVTEMR